jgi:hypothetical protein
MDNVDIYTLPTLLYPLANDNSEIHESRRQTCQKHQFAPTPEIFSSNTF